MLCSLLLVGCDEEDRIETLYVYPSKIDINDNTKETFIEIESSSGWEISLPEDCDWVEPAYYSSYVGGKYKVLLEITNRYYTQPRTAIIYVSNSQLTRSIVINQK